MQLYYVYFLAFSLLQLRPSKAAGICQPLSKMKGITVIKSHEETFKLHCSSPSHNERTGDIYNFTKFNESTGELEFIYQGKIFSKSITNYDDAGTYCCAPQYANNTKSCCYHVTVASKIDFDMNGTAYMYQNYTGSCSVTANPRMNLYMYMLPSMPDCTYQLGETLQTDQYTTRATIRVINMTANCRMIFCSTNVFQAHKVIELLLRPKPTQPTTLETLASQPSTTTYTTQLPNAGEVNNNSSSHTPDDPSSSNATEYDKSPNGPLPSFAANNHTNLLPLTIIALMSILLR